MQCAKGTTGAQEHIARFFVYKLWSTRNDCGIVRKWWRETIFSRFAADGAIKISFLIICAFTQKLQRSAHFMSSTLVP